MSKIDYNLEVLKIYPKAFVHEWSSFEAYEIRIPRFIWFSKPIGYPSFKIENAWQSAYNQLTKQNK